MGILSNVHERQHLLWQHLVIVWGVLFAISFLCSHNCWSWLKTVLPCVFYCSCCFPFYNIGALILLGLGDHIYQAFKGQVLEGSVICFAWTSVDGYWKGSGQGRRKRESAAKRKNSIKKFKMKTCIWLIVQGEIRSWDSNVFVYNSTVKKTDLFTLLGCFYFSYSTMGYCLGRGRCVRL